MKYIKILEYEYQLKRVGVPDYYPGGNMELGKDGKNILVCQDLHQE